MLSVITMIGISAVAVGVATLIVVLAVMTGFQEDMIAKILGAHSHLVVFSEKNKIDDWSEVVKTIHDLPGVQAASPYVHGEVMATTTDHAAGVVLRGVDPDAALQATNLEKSIDRGSIQMLVGEQEVVGPIDSGDKTEKLPGIILGRELASLLRVFIGEKLYVINPVGEVGPFGVIPKTKEFVVVGLFKSGLYEFDAKYAFVHLQQAQGFFDMGQSVSGIEVRLENIWSADRVAKQANNVLPAGLYAKDWQELNRSLFSAIKLEKLVMFIILCLIIFVAALNIFSNLYMVIMDKKKSIAMLRAMGASARRIQVIIFTQGMFIGVMGSFIGAALGLAICLLQMKYGMIRLDPRVYYIDTLPMTLKIFDFLVIWASSLMLCLIATLIPARIASRLDAVQVLRYE